MGKTSSSAGNGEAKYLQEMAELLEEVAEDNTTLVSNMNRVLENQESLRSDVFREFGLLRQELVGSLRYQALKDICREIATPLGAMETMLEQADFSDAETTRSHVNSLVITLQNILSQMGVEKISINPGSDLFDPHYHKCVGLCLPGDSPFPDAPQHTIVRIIEDGYLLSGYMLSPAKVEVQSEQKSKDSN